MAKNNLESEDKTFRGDAELITTNPPLVEVFKYTSPNSAINLYEPQKMYTASNTIGAPYHVGVRVTPVSTLLYYYGNNSEFWFAEDVGYRCEGFDLDFAENAQKADNTAMLFAGACEEGGEVWIRYFLKGMTSGSTKAGKSGFGVGAWDVKVSAIGETQTRMPIFLVTARDRSQNKLTYLTITLKQDQYYNYDFDTINYGSTLLTGIDVASSFAYKGTQAYGVLLTTNLNQNSLQAKLVDAQGNLTPLNDVVLPADIRPYYVFCKTFANQGHCIIEGLGSVLQDFVLTIDEKNLSISASKI